MHLKIVSSTAATATLYVKLSEPSDVSYQPEKIAVSE